MVISWFSLLVLAWLSESQPLIPDLCIVFWAITYASTIICFIYMFLLIFLLIFPTPESDLNSLLICLENT